MGTLMEILQNIQIARVYRTIQRWQINQAMILLIIIHIFNVFLSLFQSSSYINYHLTVILKPHITPFSFPYSSHFSSLFNSSLFFQSLLFTVYFFSLFFSFLFHPLYSSLLLVPQDMNGTSRARLACVLKLSTCSIILHQMRYYTNRNRILSIKFDHRFHQYHNFLNNIKKLKVSEVKTDFPKYFNT